MIGLKKASAMSALFLLLGIAVPGIAPQAGATDYLVSGAGTEAVNGVYVEDGEYNGKPKYTKGEYRLGYRGCDTKWVIVDGNDDGNIDPEVNCPLYKNTTDSELPPSSGWTTGKSGTVPAPSVVVLARPALNYSSDTFLESDDNDGTIDNATPLTITHNNFDGDAFTGADGVDFVAQGKIQVSNLPSGLTAVATRASDTELSVTITGNAAAHDNANDVADLTFAFQDSAFTGGDASVVYNSDKNDLGVNFIEVHTVGSGLDFTTIQGAINDAVVKDFDILSLGAETFTEPDIELTGKSLAIIGQGAGQTIVQADASYDSGCDASVFYIHTNYDAPPISVRLENMTVRHGDLSTSQFGGGIYAENKVDLEVRNCWIADNRIDCEGNSWGGGMSFKGNSLLIENSTLSGNTCQDGGGIHIAIVYGCVTIRNCTISGNSAYSHGGGLMCTSQITIENTTIAYNSAVSYGDGIFSYVPIYLKNAIVANNGTEDISNYYNEAIDMENCIYGTLVNGFGGGDDIGNQQGVDPMLNPLAVNDGGSTATHSLKTGSPAIGAGTSSGLAYSTDQNGKAHVGNPDIGAYEYHGPEGGNPDWIGSESSDNISGGPLLEVADGSTDIAKMQITGGSGAASFTVERFDTSCGSPCPANFWWNATVTGDFTGDLTFYYDENELNGMAEADLKLYHWNQDSEEWQDWGGEVDTAGNSITVSGLADENFSPFALNVSSPNLVFLNSFEARYANGGTLLTWETASEIDNAGFHVWRAQSRHGRYERITESIILAEGDSTTGALYAFEDPEAPGSRFFYKLEDIDYGGNRSFHAPTCRTMRLEAGWNAVDGAAFEGLPVAQALFAVQGDLVSVWTLAEDEWKLYNPQLPDLSDLEAFEAGRLHWIGMEREATLYLP